METSNYNIIKHREDGYIVFNSFSKATIKLNEDIGSKIINNDICGLSNNIRDALFEQGILVNDKKKEKEILQKQYNKIRNSSDSLFITLLPTMKCNFRCPYCFEGSESKCSEIDMDFAVLKKAASVMFKGKKHIHITLFGGEPLIKWNEIKDLFNYIKELSEAYGFAYSSCIATNGYYLSEEICNDLIEICNTESFQITIDGCETSHNITRKLINGDATYRTVLNNFKTLTKYNINKKINLLLRVNLLNNTLEEVESMLKDFSEEEKKCFEVYFRPIYNTREFNEDNQNSMNLETFYRLAKNEGFKTHYGNYVRFWHCEGDGGSEQIHILPDLSIWKCVNDLRVDEAKIGRILDTGEIELNYGKINNWKNNDPFKDERCCECKFLPICWGGCPLKHLTTGSRYCIYEQKFDFLDTFF